MTDLQKHSKGEPCRVPFCTECLGNIKQVKGVAAQLLAKNVPPEDSDPQKQEREELAEVNEALRSLIEYGVPEEKIGHLGRVVAALLAKHVLNGQLGEVQRVIDDIALHYEHTSHVKALKTTLVERKQELWDQIKR